MPRYAGKGYHGGVAVAADYDAFDFGSVCTESEAEEVFEASAVECAAHADDAVFGQAAYFVDEVCHGVHGVRHAQDDCVGRVGENLVCN